MDVIVEIVHTRTGYPRDMLAPELDLEADLSIDSIKRVEIIGALADRIGLPQDAAGSAEDAIEELSRIKTLRGIVDWVSGHTARPEPPAAEAPATAPPALGRLRVEPQVLPAAPGDPEVLRGLRIGVVGVVGDAGDFGEAGDGQGIGAAVTGALRAQGVDVRQLGQGEAGFDALIDLSALRPGAPPVLPEAFPGLRLALTGGVHRLLLVTARGEAAGAGVHGFARSACLEYPGRLIRAVEVHSKEDPERIAAQLLAELSCAPAAEPTAPSAEATAPASVAYTADGLRVTPRPVPAPLAPGDGTPPLDADSVVLLTGGARGITARTALALARATGCHVELMGRTPQPPPEADEFGHAADRVALRAALIATGLRTPAEIEAAASRILAEREVRATLAALATVAASVGYHCADVTDEQAVRVVVAAVRARHGRLDGIVHGAGTLNDGLLRDKQPAAFAEVFATKVTGARHLAAAAAEHGAAPAPRFLALFGSVAGVYGNRGQTDYAAANDALDGLAHLWAESFPGRVLSIDWGPWAAESGGMVSPELARAYGRRGIPLIDPDAGGAAFLAELAHGTDVQVVLMAAEGDEGVSGVPDRDRQGRGSGQRRHHRGPRPTDAAIVGMGAVFPGAADLAAYRRNLLAGTDCIGDVPPGRWDPEVYYDPDGANGPASGDRFYCRRGGFVDGLAAFDPTRFGIMPATVEGAEPDQMLALHATAEAIADAGGEGRLPADRSRIGIVLGRGGFMGVATARLDQRVRTAHQLAQTLRELAPDLGERRIAAVRSAFQEALGPERPDASIGLVPSFTAARTANRLDFHGPAYTLDAACASSLLAVDQAVGLLAGGRCDAVVAGAVHHCHIATLWSVFTQLRALSPSERIRPFDRRADGTLLSEGTGVVLLKRLADAERDGDRIYAVIRGTGVAGDGRAASLMSPLVAGQVRALERAWREAGLDPRAPGALGLLEAHGTGTPVGDTAELDTLARVFGPYAGGGDDGAGGDRPAGDESGAANGLDAGNAIGFGSVKSMLGHTMQASGMAGLIKAALAVYEGCCRRPCTWRSRTPAWPGPGCGR